MNEIGQRGIIGNDEQQKNSFEEFVRMIEVHFYGNLRGYAPDSRFSSNSMIAMAIVSGDTVETILNRLGIETDQISTIFLNSKLFVSRSPMAHWLGYVQVRDNPLEWDLSLAVKDGDRIGLFGRDMPSLVI
jgi:hypothetical protein